MHVLTGPHHVIQAVNSQFCSFLALLPHTSVTYEILLCLEPQQHKATLSKNNQPIPKCAKDTNGGMFLDIFLLGRVNTEESNTKVIKMSHQWM